MATHVSHRASILLPPPNSVQSLNSTAPYHRGSRSQSRPVIVSQPHVRFAKYQVSGQYHKAPLLHGLIADNDLSLLALTETWVKSDDPQ